jgi:uncharacterized Tic20 family protein
MEEENTEMLAEVENTEGEAAIEVPTDEWTTAALAHASILLTMLLGTSGVGIPVGLAVPLVMYLGYKRQSRFVAFHALQAFCYQLAGILIGVVLGGLTAVLGTISGALSGVLIGLALVPFTVSVSLLLAGGAVAWVVYALYAAYQVYQGRDLRYWLIGEYLEREVKL